MPDNQLTLSDVPPPASSPPIDALAIMPAGARPATFVMSYALPPAVLPILGRGERIQRATENLRLAMRTIEPGLSPDERIHVALMAVARLVLEGVPAEDIPDRAAWWSRAAVACIRDYAATALGAAVDG